MKWYFIRHGETASNVNKIFAGWNDDGLTQNGISQAQEAARQLAGSNIDAVYCSPLNRAAQTAQIISDSLNMKPLKIDSFIELKFGIWEGMSIKEVRQKYPEEWQIWQKKPAELILPGRETLQELQVRMLAGMAAIAESKQHKAALVVTHISNLRVVALHAAGKELHEYKSIQVDNCKIFAFGNMKLPAHKTK